MENNIKTVKLPDGSEMPKLGQGTWQMAEDDAKMEREIAGLRHGIERGIRMIDTAEMYAEGKAESLAGDAIKGLDRSELYIVSKVYPQNANKKHMFSSLERSLKLLGTDYLDMYLLHWREDADLAEMVWCMEKLKDEGKIKRWGVSNFDVADMDFVTREVVCPNCPNHCEVICVYRDGELIDSWGNRCERGEIKQGQE